MGTPLTMRNRFSILPAALAAALAMAWIPSASVAAVHADSAARVETSQARFGPRGFGRRAPVYRPHTRSRAPYRSTYRRSPFRRFFGGVLKFLGVAYLMHVLFGWGAGGSPFGLLVLGAIVLWVASRSRRRRVYW
jgi:uncharacterized membrane protein